MVDVPWAFALSMGGLGLLIGSFLNVVCHRLPRMLERQWRSECRALLEISAVPEAPEPRYDLLVPRSRCPECAHPVLVSAARTVPSLPGADSGPLPLG